MSNLNKIRTLALSFLAFALLWSTLAAARTQKQKEKPKQHDSAQGEICVTTFHDVNDNGVQDPGEPGLPNWTFSVSGGGTITTGLKGSVCLRVSAPGTYTISEGLQRGWTPTTPNPQTVTVSPGLTLNLSFGNRRGAAPPVKKAEICVRKFNDLNGDGKQQSNEPGLPNWTFTVNGGVGAVNTGPQGSVCFGVSAPGTYTVSEVLQRGWTPTTPNPQTVTVSPGLTLNLNFGNGGGPPQPGKAEICVTKFNDLNGNGKQDPGEPPLFGWKFDIKDNAGNLVGTVITDKEKPACLTVPAPGTFTITEQVQNGWTATTPNPQKVTVSAGKSVSLSFGNEIRPEEKCCQFGLMLYNSLTNTIKKVVIIPTDPLAVIGVYNGEEPDWTLTKSGNQYVIAPPDPPGFLPANPSEVLDLDFALKVDPALSPTTVTVRWLNASGQVLKEELLKLECQPHVGDENFEYDWFSMRRTIRGLSDKVLFSGAEPEECEDFEREEMASVCGFTNNVKCVGGQHRLELTASFSGANSYLWDVNDNGASTSLGGSATGQTVSYNLTEGPHAITVNLAVTAQGVTETCEPQPIDACIPTAQFSVGTARPDCRGGLLRYHVDFSPQDTESYCNILNFLWDFGDPSSGASNHLSVNSADAPVSHTYTNPGTYTATLTVTDSWNCTHTIEHPVVISSSCEPRFHIEYELCTGGDGPVAVNVKFVNDSQAFCHTTFDWDFGDPSSGASNHLSVNSADAPVSHMYTYSGSTPKDYTIKLTMKDDPCPGGKSITATFTLKPVALSLKVLVCPNGETHFVCQTAGKVNWNLHGVGFLSDCWVKRKWANLLQHKHFACSAKDGTYGVDVEATEEDLSSNALVSVTRTCKKRLEFTVTRTCCDDFTAKDHKDKTVGNKVYRMEFKHKVVNPTFGPDTRIVGKTKFKVKKSISSGIFYYKGIRAETTTVRITDNLRIGGPHPTDPTVTCKRCINPTQSSGYDTRYDSSKAKYKTWVSARGTNKNDKLSSVHYVRHKAGWDWTITVEKPQGQMCDQWTATP